MSKPRLVIVGGVSGVPAVVELRKEGFDGGITVAVAAETFRFLPRGVGAALGVRGGHLV